MYIIFTIKLQILVNLNLTNNYYQLHTLKAQISDFYRLTFQNPKIYKKTEVIFNINCTFMYI